MHATNEDVKGEEAAPRPLFTELPRETVRKGARAAPEPQFCCPSAAKQGFLGPFRQLLRLQLGVHWGFSDSFTSPILGNLEQLRFVQLTPPGSGCSIQVGKGIVDMPPDTLEGLQLVVPDLEAARAQRVERGVEASEIQVFDEDGLRPSRDGDILDNVGFVSFSDPDGNRWAVQQISFRG